MDAQEFEQAILKLAFETDARITTASVAYYLGIPSRKANQLLNALLEEGVLELDSDAEGNLYYRVPNKGDTDILPQLRFDELNGRDGASEPGAAEHASPEDGPTATTRPRTTELVGPDEARQADPVSPRAHRPQGADATPGARRAEPTAETGADGMAGPARRAHTFSLGERSRQQPVRFESDPAPRQVVREQTTVAGGMPRRDQERPSRWQRRPVATRERTSERELFAGLTQRHGAPDASLDSCGASAVVLGDTARCAPRPLPSRKPVLASCIDGAASGSSIVAGDGFTEKTTALAPVDRRRPASTAVAAAANPSAELMARGDHLERPEHQPGMALLLSLILCGTGQIYNGEVSKGIMMMVLCFLLWFVLLGWVVHIWSIVDSVVVAERLNRTAPSH